jgi:hypothetical protein
MVYSPKGLHAIAQGCRAPATWDCFFSSPGVGRLGRGGRFSSPMSRPFYGRPGRRGLVHFSADTRSNGLYVSSENMDLTPLRPDFAVLLQGGVGYLSRVGDVLYWGRIDEA